mmetsp:Transcript_38827/g.109860  ORF Transcript_38827/g.109860 Transcript_38827/m.109860 type:complete len:204 (-) Transcript_38827:2295-2906(-)
MSLWTRCMSAQSNPTSSSWFCGISSSATRSSGCASCPQPLTSTSLCATLEEHPPFLSQDARSRWRLCGWRTPSSSPATSSNRTPTGPARPRQPARRPARRAISRWETTCATISCRVAAPGGTAAASPMGARHPPRCSSSQAAGRPMASPSGSTAETQSGLEAAAGQRGPAATLQLAPCCVAWAKGAAALSCHSCRLRRLTMRS